MSRQTTVFQKAYTLEDDTIEKNVAVVRGSADASFKVPTADNELPLGICMNDEYRADNLRQPLITSFAGTDVGIELHGIGDVTADGDVSFGDRVYITIGGKVKTVPATPGTYNVLGIAETSATDGNLVSIKINPHQVVVA